MCKTLIYPVNKEGCQNIIVLIVFGAFQVFTHFHYFLISTYNFRLVQYLRQRLGNECTCHKAKYEENRRAIHHSSEPKIWTLSERQDPVYEDIDIEKFRQKRKINSYQNRNSSNIIYGYITAKEVAKFRPITSPKSGE